jgi:hypothetical protein
MTYIEMVERGKKMIAEHTIWLVLGAAVILVAYVFIHKKIMHGSKCAVASADVAPGNRD